jgi:hypothetical protein
VAGEFRCAKAGSLGDQQPCVSDLNAGDDCQTGLFCSFGSNKCTTICDAQSPCPAGQLCALTLTVAGKTMFDVCDVMSAECDALAQDCPNAAQGCYDGASGTKCATAGSVADGADCKALNDCQKGSQCTNINSGGFKCHHTCNLASPSCAQGACLKLSGNDAYGLCG